MDVENVVAEQRLLSCVSVMLGQDLMEQSLALEQVVAAAGQTSTDLHHQVIRQKLQTVYCA